jgi:uncharacterized protein YciI
MNYLLLYRPPRPTFAEDATEEEDRIIGEHFQYLKSLLAQGKLLIAGPCEDASLGLAVIECENDEEARKVMAADPAVRGRVFTCEMKPYRVALARTTL